MRVWQLGALLVLSFFAVGCINSMITGANMIYNRHSLYKTMSDFQLTANASRALYRDTALKCANCFLDVEAFNGDLLVAGHLPSRALRKEAKQRIAELDGYRRVLIHIAIVNQPGNTVEDSWITAKIRSAIIADADIDPKAFKVVTADRIVYLMGDVKPSQAKKVIHIARNTTGVRRVVRMFKYYHLMDKAEANQATIAR